MLADEVLRLAERIVTLKQQIERLSSELADAKEQYNKLIERLGVGNASASRTRIQGGIALRERILEFLKEHPGVPIRLYDIEHAVDTEHRRVIWTLSNLQRNGLVAHPQRDVWLVEWEQRAEEEDIPF